MSTGGSVWKRVFAGAALAASFALAYGCGGFSEEQAKERCNVEQESRGTCFDDKSFADCVSCFESCGDDCVPSNACPERFNCPSDQNSTGKPE